ncbi:3-isopropylmalate dehydrogenase 2 [Morus notabilis]|uniref:3-isopropylmalate dehydrogenase 2 n=1 Tax=Morus notabilis TaxID=981085 RepID=W9QNQ7_9ROSA|nr:3-isopropylmalate dehydrogenase 2 [Morus notabilis]
MAACLRLNTKTFTAIFLPNSVPKFSVAKARRIRCSAASPSKRYTITLLPGDGIGPEVISVAKNVLNLAASLEGRYLVKSAAQTS